MEANVSHSDLRGWLARRLLGLRDNDVRYLRYLVVLRQRDKGARDCPRLRRLRQASERMGAKATAHEC